MRMHGSVLPKLILPLFSVALWSTLITCISRFVQNREFRELRGWMDGSVTDGGNAVVGIDNILLTVLGFVVGLALSFRSSTAYERLVHSPSYYLYILLTGLEDGPMDGNTGLF